MGDNTLKPKDTKPDLVARLIANGRRVTPRVTPVSGLTALPHPETLFCKRIAALFDITCVYVGGVYILTLADRTLTTDDASEVVSMAAEMVSRATQRLAWQS